MSKDTVKRIMNGIVGLVVAAVICAIIGIPLAAYFLQWGSFRTYDGVVVERAHTTGYILMGTIWGFSALLGVSFGWSMLWDWSHNKADEDEVEEVEEEANVC